MKYTRINEWRKWIKGDLFARTQSRLTIFYSGLITLFLVIFVVIALFIVYNVSISDQEQRLNNLADYELQELQTMFSPHHRRTPMMDQERFLSGNQLFYYVTNTQGDLLIANESIDPMRSLYLDEISNWKTTKSEITQASIQVPTDQPAYSQFRNFTVKVLMLARPIFINDQLAGMMYIGVDNSNFNRMFKWVMIVFISLAILFIGVGIWLSRLMSKRALIPIEKSYHQQREFIANASHELRTPLSVIFSSVEALEMDIHEKDTFTQKIITGLKHEAQRMRNLINDLLTLARLDAEQTSLQLTIKWFDIVPQTGMVVQSFKKLASEKNINLKLETPDAIDIYGDTDKLEQLLYILLDNAIKYTPNGGNVVVELAKQHGQFILSVQDSGIGITEDEKQRIFDRFYRVDKARTRKEGGHGLGLSIAKWIVDAHQGKIAVKSQPDNGTTFIITLPLPTKE